MLMLLNKSNNSDNSDQENNENENNIFIFKDIESLPSKTKSGITVVVDLDGTLITHNISHELNIFLRPNVNTFLRTLYENDVEIILWSAGNIDHVNSFMKLINSNYIDFCIARGSWFSGLYCEKNLELLVDDIRDINSIIMIENTVYSVQKQYDHGIIIDTYDLGKYNTDVTLIHLTLLIININENFVKNHMYNVSDFIRNNKMLAYSEHKHGHNVLKWYEFLCDANKNPSDIILSLENIELNCDLDNEIDFGYMKNDNLIDNLINNICEEDEEIACINMSCV